MTEAMIGINPKILKWARERARYSLEDVALKLKKDIDIIKSWESGEKSPTYVQLEKLAYEIYKRPIALFFFPEPPEESDEQSEFRTLPEFEINKLSSNTVYILRQAKAMQLSLKELNDGSNPSQNRIFRDLSIDLDKNNLKGITQEVRDYLNVELDEQFSWKNDDDALKKWRDIIEVNGIFIFKQSFEQKDISGFCLIDQEFPIIYLNNSTAKVRQIFTIFHELAHILLQVSGITKVDDEYIDFLEKDSKKIEIFCNQFAAEFLVPTESFFEDLDNYRDSYNDQLISEFSQKYSISREVILRKLLDNNLITQNDYETKVKSWQDQYAKTKQSKSDQKGGGNYYATQATYLGDNYLKLVFNKYYQGKFGMEALADYLNIKVKNVPKLEQFLLDRKDF
ncbi:MAG: ImmA/IrrE family metallo-endopeptidase [Crocosphaera sp.]|nr:ImmA/IrrE family metallo-endopeptidase [Crocosphaera sp.]